MHRKRKEKSRTYMKVTERRGIQIHSSVVKPFVERDIIDVDSEQGLKLERTDASSPSGVPVNPVNCYVENLSPSLSMPVKTKTSRIMKRPAKCICCKHGIVVQCEYPVVS